MSNPQLTLKIKSKAYELGFSGIGIVKAVPLTDESGYFMEWLNKKYNAGMQWMERQAEKRLNPALVLPGIKSIICVAMNYFSPSKHTDSPDTGKISRYAWGDDYHEIMTERMQMLLDFLKTEIPELKAKIYSDTGPMMDKIWAVRSGIGWMGKHSNVISRKYSSWIFLGEILLDTELEYDKPIAELCGTCTACIDACPTNAIVEPYVVDSNRCISYLTIEHRGGLPEKYLSKFQNWVYGCDICQDVCPWNKFCKITTEKAFYPRAENLAPKLTDLAEINDGEFKKRFRRSPIKRAKREGLVRNAKGLLESAKSSE